jgi:hypothetical protein
MKAALIFKGVVVAVGAYENMLMLREATVERWKLCKAEEAMLYVVW